MARFSDLEAGVLRKIQKRKKKKPAEGLVPFREGFAPQESDLPAGDVPLATGLTPQEDVPTEPLPSKTSQPALIKRSLKKGAKKADKALDDLQEGITGKKTTDSNKMSDDMKTALLAGLPILIGGLLGGEEGLGAGAEAAQVGLGVQAKEQATAAQAAIKQQEIGIKQQEVAVKSQEAQSKADLQASQVGLNKVKEQALLNKQSQEPELSEAQSKSRIFGSRMAQSEEDFTSLIGTFDPTTSGSATSSTLLPEALQSEERQQFRQAKRNFLNAVLRKESGAKISEEEIETGELQYFPKFGDAPKVVAQKARNRKLVTDLMLQEGKVDLNDPRIRRNFAKTTKLQQIQAIKTRRGL